MLSKIDEVVKDQLSKNSVACATAWAAPRGNPLILNRHEN